MSAENFEQLLSIPRVLKRQHRKLRREEKAVMETKYFYGSFPEGKGRSTCSNFSATISPLRSEMNSPEICITFEFSGDFWRLCFLGR